MKRRLRIDAMLPVLILWSVAGILGWHIAMAAIASLQWPLINDPPIFHYIASRIMEGAAPYRDIYDMNMPLTYVLHMAAIGIFGVNDIGFRYFDLMWLVLTMLAMVIYCKDQPKQAGVLAALLFAGCHIVGGVYQAGQRDYFMVLFLVLAADQMAKYLTAGFDARKLVVCGIWIALAAAIKPHAVLFGLLVWFVAYAHPDTELERGHLARRMLAGFMMPVLGVTVWLSLSGGLSAFLSMGLDMLLGGYTLFGNLALTGNDWRVFMLVAAMVVIFPAGRTDVRNQLLLAGIIYALGCKDKCVSYGWLHYYLQQRGWSYQLKPFLAFVILALGYNLPSALAARPALQKLGIYGVLAGFVALYSPLSLFRPQQMYQYPNLAVYFEELQDNIASASAKIPAEIAQTPQAKQYPVHFIDFTIGHLWNAGYRYRWQTASRHIYPLPLVLDQSSPRVQKLQAELVADLSAHLPQLIVISCQTGPYLKEQIWPVIARNAGMNDLLERYYQLSVKQDCYRIYARNGTLPPLPEPEKPRY